MVIGIFVYFQRMDPSVLWVDLLFVLLIMLAWAWVGGHRITIAETAVTFRSPLSGIRTISIADIDDARIASFSPSNLSEALGPPVRLWLYPTDGSGIKPISINAKLFSREDLKEIISLAKHHSANQQT
jgi:hypothetical protein